MTENGYLVGAPFYMSPERLTAIDTANEQCDIWSYGVTFYEWLSGRHPFYDDDGDQMIGNIVDATPAPLTDVPPALNSLILRALEKAPAQRYRHFGELLADLKPLVTDLKREESDALMAEALKQTDSGRWHEARRIARQMRNLESQQANRSQIFGVSEAEPTQDWPPPAPQPEPIRRVVSTQTAAASASTAAIAEQTPEPPPPPSAVAQPTVTPKAAATPMASAPAALPKPPRPERTAPKISPFGLRHNNSASAGNSAPVETRFRPKPAVPARNGARAAAATVPGSASEKRLAEARRNRPAPAAPNGGVAAIAPFPPTMRMLEAADTTGFSWLRTLGFTVPALLMAGALFFFLHSNPRAGISPQEAKTVSGDRVITDHAARGESAKPLTKSESSKLTELSPATPANNPVASTPPAANPDTKETPEAAAANGGTEPLWRTFDPNSLKVQQPKIAGRRTPNRSTQQAGAAGRGGQRNTGERRSAGQFERTASAGPRSRRRFFDSDASDGATQA